MDADTLVVENIDELFDRDELSATPDIGWPDCFNSGVFVFKPAEATFKGLVEMVQAEGSFDGGDQVPARGVCVSLSVCLSACMQGIF